LWFQSVASLIDVLNYTWLLWIFRPRKEWPERYGLEIGDILLNGPNRFGQRNQAKRAPLQDVVIDNELLKDSTALSINKENNILNHLQPDECIMVLNPTEATFAAS